MSELTPTEIAELKLLAEKVKGIVKNDNISINVGLTKEPEVDIIDLTLLCSAPKNYKSSYTIHRVKSRQNTLHNLEWVQ